MITEPSAAPDAKGVSSYPPVVDLNFESSLKHPALPVRFCKSV